MNPAVTSFLLLETLKLPGDHESPLNVSSAVRRMYVALPL